MTPTVIHVEQVSSDLAKLREQVERLVGQLADAELQRDDARSERDQEHRLVVALEAALANSAAIEQAIGIIAGGVRIGTPIAPARPGAPDVARIIDGVGVPPEFWNALTLNGEIFK